MATPALNQQQPSPLESLLHSWSVQSPPTPTASSLIEEILYLLDISTIQLTPQAKNLLEGTLEAVEGRNGLEPLQEQELRFYNHVQNLLNTQGKVNTYCLDRLKTIHLELVSLKQAAHETTLFKGTKTYKISFAQSFHHQEAGWYLGARGNLARDRRDQDSTYVIAQKSATIGALWHIFSEDKGKTYKIVLAVDDYAQKNWVLGTSDHYPQDRRAGNTDYCFIQKPAPATNAWHLEPDDTGKKYQIKLATHNIQKKNWRLTVHRGSPEIRDSSSTYVFFCAPVHRGDEYWKIESE